MDSFTHEAITLYHQDFNVGDLIALLSGSHAAEMWGIIYKILLLTMYNS